MPNGRRRPSLGRTSRVNREVYARFCERLAVRFRGPTRQLAVRNFRGLCQEDAKASCCTKRWRWALRSRLIGGGFKLPGAASVKSCGGERPWLKGVAL